MQKYAIPSSISFLDRSPIVEGEYPILIRDLPSEGKPREKLLAQGPEALSMRELAALLLVTGTTREDVLEMSSRIVRDYGEKNIFAERNANRLSNDLDIPIVKACTIVAVGELIRRFASNTPSGFTTIRTSRDVYEHLSDMRDLRKEHLRGLYLNAHNRVIRDEIVSIGTVDANIIHARDVFRIAIECNAAAVVIAHNHPSGETDPSPEDVEVTNRLIQAGKIIGIPVLDHVIIARSSYASVPADYR